MVKKFKKGDIIYLNFNPQKGHEQQGRRPAIVVTNDLYNKMCNLTFVCPITSTDNKHPFHVPLNNQTKTHGVILCEQLKSLDLTKRDAEFKETAPKEIVEEVVDIIKGFIE